MYAGSIPTQASSRRFHRAWRYNRFIAGIAQLVERNLAKVEVEGSSPFSRSSFEKGSAQAGPFFVVA